MDIIRATGSAAGRCPSVTANGLIWTVATAGGEGTTVRYTIAQGPPGRYRKRQKC